MLKTIGSDHLYDSWIEDICWVTPKALALCPAQKSTEPVKMIYINDVDNVRRKSIVIDSSSLCILGRRKRTCPYSRQFST